MVEQIESKQLKLYGHLVRMEEERKEKEVFDFTVEGRRRNNLPVVEQIERKQLKWYGHLVRMGGKKSKGGIRIQSGW